MCAWGSTLYLSKSSWRKRASFRHRAFDLPQRANYLGHLGRGTDSRDDTGGFKVRKLPKSILGLARGMPLKPVNRKTWERDFLGISACK